MAQFTLPSLDEFLSRDDDTISPALRRALAPPPVVARPEPPPLTPNQQAQADLLANPRGALGEIGAGLARGALYELPKMIGQGLKATGKKGDMLYDFGQKVIDSAEPNNTRFFADRNPDAHNAVTDAFAQGASMIAPSVSALAFAPLAGAAGLGALGTGLVTGGAAAGLFGAQQYQDTYEKAKEAGLSDHDAHIAGLKTGAIEGLGEAVATPVLGRLASAGGRVLTKKMDLPTAIKAIQDPQFWRTFGKEMAHVGAVETGTEMGQAFGEALVEKNAGISTDDPYKAAVSAIGPTLAMTAMLGPLAAHGIRRQMNQNRTALAAAQNVDPSLPEYEQLGRVSTAAGIIEQQLKPIVGPAQAVEWRLQQLEKANADIAGVKSAAEEKQDAANLPPLMEREDADREEAQRQGLIDQHNELNRQADITRQQGTGAVMATALEGQLGDQQNAQQDQIEQANAAAALRAREQQLELDAPNHPAQVAQGQQDIDAAAAADHLREQAAQEALAQHVQSQVVGEDTRAFQEEAARPQRERAAAAEQAAQARDEATRAAAQAANAPTKLHAALVEAQQAFEANRTEANFKAREKAAQAIHLWSGRAAEHARLYTELQAVANVESAESPHGYRVDPALDVTTLRGQEATRLQRGLNKVAQEPTDQQPRALRGLSRDFATGSVGRNALETYANHLEGIHAEAVNVRNQTAAQERKRAKSKSAADEVAARDSSLPQGTNEGAAQTGSNDAQDANGQVTTLNPVKAEKAAPPGWVDPGNKFGMLAAKLVIPEDKQRPLGSRNNGEFDRYEFEHYVYDPDARPAQGENGKWLESLMRARKDAAMKVTERTKRKVQNAKAALAFADEHHGADVAAADARHASLLADRERMAEFRARSQVENLREHRQIIHEMAAEFRNKESPTGTTKMSKAKGMELARDWAKENGIDLDAVDALDRIEKKTNTEINKRLKEFTNRAIYKGVFNFEVAPEDVISEPLIKVMEAKGADAKGVLTHIATTSEEAGNRALARRLLRMNLSTTFSYKDEESRGEDGNLRGGTFTQSENSITIFRNGETEHAVLHEFVHAATAGRLGRALDAVNIPPSRRTLEEQGLVQDLYELRKIMDEAKSRDRGNEYGFKNEHEFVAEIQSSQRFRISIFRRFTEWVKGMLGIRSMSDHELESAVARALRASEKFFTGEDTTQGAAELNQDNNATPLERVERMWNRLYGMLPQLEQAALAGAETTIHNDIAIYKQDFVKILAGWKSSDEGVKKGLAEGWLKPEQAAAITENQDKRIARHIEKIQGMLDKASQILPGNPMPELNLPAAVTQNLDRFLASNDPIANIPDRVRATVISLSSAYQLGRRFERSPHAPLRAFGEKLRKIEEINDQRARVMQEMGSASYGLTRQIELALRSLPEAQRRLTRQKMGRVGVEMSRLNIDLNKDYDGNQRDGADLERTDGMKAWVNNLHADYMSLDPKFRIPLNNTFAMNRKLYIQQAAVTFTAYLNTRQSPDVKAVLAPIIARLDILDPTLSANTAARAVDNTKLPYYLDNYTEELDNRLKAAFKTIKESELLKNDVTAGIEKYYKAAVGNPYQHLGRMGNHFVEFEIKDNPEALAAVQGLINPSGKVIGEPTKLSRHVFLRYENRAQWAAVVTDLHKLQDTAGHIAGLQHGNLLEAGILEQVKGVDQFVHALNAALESRAAFGVGSGATKEEQNAANEVRQLVERMALDMTPDSSARKSLVRRKDGGVLGAEGDFLRNYDTRSRSATAMLASTYAAPKYAHAFNDMQGAVEAMQTNPDANIQPMAQAAYASAKQRYANTLNPVETPIVDSVKAFGHAFFLGLSPSYYLTNAMQPWHLTLPILGAQYGMVKTAKAMGNATAKGFRVIKATLSSGMNEGNQLGGFVGAMYGVLDAPLMLERAGLDEHEIRFLQHLIKAGKMNETQGHEQGRVAEGGSPGLAATMKLVSAGAHHGEVLNRITAGLAAFNMERARTGSSIEKATRIGTDMVDKTQYSYSDRDAAPALGRHGFAGKMTPLFTQFMTYSFKTMELLYTLGRDASRGVPAGLTTAEQATWKEEQRIARIGFGSVMGTTALLAGTLGLPFASVITRIVDAFLGSGDDPSDIKVAYRQWLAQVFGKTMGEAIAHGLPQTVLGAATTARMGLQDLLPGTRFFTDRRDIKDAVKDGALNLAGPAVSAGVDMWTGVDHFLDGRMMDGLTEMLPLSLRNVAKAVKMANVGYTNATGNIIPIPVTGAAIATQAIGFTPAVKAEQSEGNYAFKTRDTLLKQERGKLANKIYLEIERNGGVSPGREAELTAWNQKNPTHKINLKEALQARAKARGVAEVSGTDIPAASRYLPDLQRYNYLNTR